MANKLKIQLYPVLVDIRNEHAHAFLMEVTITMTFWETKVAESKIEICIPLESTILHCNKNMERKVLTYEVFLQNSLKR